MPTTFTPEMLALLNSGGTYTDPQTGRVYRSDASTNPETGGVNAANYFYEMDPSRSEFGDPFGIYNTQGQYLNDGQYKDPGNGMDLLAVAALSALGMGAFLPGMMAGGAGAAGGAAAGAGAGGMSAAEAFALSDAVYGGSALSAGGLGSAAAGLGAGLETMAPVSLMTPEAAAGLSTFTPAVGGAGLLSAAGGAASTIGSALRDMGPLIPALVGAAVGSQPTTTQQNSVRSMDPRMDAMVYGDNGFLNHAQDFYNRNPTGMNQAMTDANAMRRGLLTNPATAQGFADIADYGQGLLAQGIAPNPYADGRPTASLFDANARRPQRPGYFTGN